ncbi:MAG: hypothetical protein V1778_04020 [bacterium]
MALFVSEKTRDLDRHFSLFHCFAQGWEIAVVISDTPIAESFLRAADEGIPTVYVDHALPRVEAWLVDICDFYDVNFILVTPEHRHGVHEHLCQFVQHWVYYLDAPTPRTVVRGPAAVAAGSFS